MNTELIELPKYFKKNFTKSISGYFSPILTLSEPGNNILPGSNPTEKRKNEYYTGRICAGNALKNVGINSYVVESGEAGGPIWPEGVVGSISHSSTLAGAIVSQEYLGMGLDIESQHRVIKKELDEKLFLKEESKWVSSFGLEKRNDLRLIMFSAKEALYKCLFPRVQKYFGFKDAKVVLNQQTGDLEITLQSNLSEEFKRGDIFKGYWMPFKNHFVIVIAI